MKSESEKRPRGRPRKPKPLHQPEKKAPGRPCMGVMAKSVNISIRVTPEEQELWKKMAKDKGITLVDFVLQPIRDSLKDLEK